MSLTIGARKSALSQAQVKEVLRELHVFYPQMQPKIILLETQGDLDQKTSLRTLGKTDFFTKEVDQLLLAGHCRIAVHSAKDLPEPLPFGLQIVALTKGLDPSDALVLREGETLETLPSGAVIATSSERREEAVRKLRADFQFIDLRGTIQQRLAKLDAKQADGVVIAEAALQRLDLTHLNRVAVPGSTVPFQGRLAILSRIGDTEMEILFKPLDAKL